MTVDEFLANCRNSKLFTEADCQLRLREQTVNGQFCDGNIVMNEAGKRCVPRAVVEAKLREQIIPPPKPTGGVPTWALVALGVVVAAGVGYALMSHK